MFYLPVLQAFFLAMLKLTVGGDREGEGVGSEGGGTLVSTHTGRGTTPVTPGPGLTGSWSWCVTRALFRMAGGKWSLELDTDLSRVSSERLRS